VLGRAVRLARRGQASSSARCAAALVHPLTCDARLSSLPPAAAQGIVALQFVRAATGWLTDDAAGLWRTSGVMHHPGSQAAMMDMRDK
jgi:hypothetical protein